MYMSSPVLVRGALYGHSTKRKGQFVAVDPESGKILWATEGRNAASASVLAAGQHLVYLTTDSQLIVAPIDAAAFRELRRYNVASSTTYAHPLGFARPRDRPRRVARDGMDDEVRWLRRLLVLTIAVGACAAPISNGASIGLRRPSRPLHRQQPYRRERSAGHRRIIVQGPRQRRLSKRRPSPRTTSASKITGTRAARARPSPKATGRSSCCSRGRRRCQNRECCFGSMRGDSPARLGKTGARTALYMVWPVEGQVA